MAKNRVKIECLNKDCFVWELAEYIRSLCSANNVYTMSIFTKRYTSTEFEAWYNDEYNKDANIIYYVLSVDGRRMGFARINMECLISGRIGIEYVIDPVVYSTLCVDSFRQMIIQTIKHYENSDDKLFYRKFIFYVSDNNVFLCAMFKALKIKREAYLKGEIVRNSVPVNVSRYAIFKKNLKEE
jgi:hypothetical protein